MYRQLQFLLLVSFVSACANTLTGSDIEWDHCIDEDVGFATVQLRRDTTSPEHISFVDAQGVEQTILQFPDVAGRIRFKVVLDRFDSVVVVIKVYRNSSSDSYLGSGHLLVTKNNSHRDIVLVDIDLNSTLRCSPTADLAIPDGDADLASVQDALVVAPDLGVLRDLAIVPDIPALTDLVKAPDLVTVPDLVNVPDLVSVPDLIPSDLTINPGPSTDVTEDFGAWDVGESADDNIEACDPVKRGRVGLVAETANQGNQVVKVIYGTSGYAYFQALYPKSRNAGWNLSKRTGIEVSIRGDLPSSYTGWQFAGPTIVLCGPNGYRRLDPKINQLSRSGAAYNKLQVPLTGDNDWIAIDSGTFNLALVNWVEFHADPRKGLGSGTCYLWLDGVRFY